MTLRTLVIFLMGMLVASCLESLPGKAAPRAATRTALTTRAAAIAAPPPILPEGESFPAVMIPHFAGTFYCGHNGDDGGIWLVCRCDCDPSFAPPNGVVTFAKRVVIAPGDSKRAFTLTFCNLFADWIEPPLPGDFNGDRIVDSADFDVWFTNIGQRGVAGPLGE